MDAFRYAASPDAIRPDLADAHRRAWEHIARPGTWLGGDERVAVAEETRRARDCALCRERKAAVSPFSVDGEHDHGGVLSGPVVDAIHRITTDAARLSEAWYRSLLDAGLRAETYVEALGVAVLTISIDRFHHALGLPLEPLPRPVVGEPSRLRPQGVVEGEAWVPMQPSRQLAATIGAPASAPVPFVLRALSLVPAEMHAWVDLGGAQYLSPEQMRSFERVRSIGRSQIELIAGRVSALNECFY